MAWIESHTLLGRHRKLLELARGLRIRPSYALGHLHALWHACLEQAEDGDISLWSDEMIADMSDFPADAPQYVQLLYRLHWLDGEMGDDGTPRRLLIHDWLDYAGKYLTAKYASKNRDRLVDIWAKHGREYGNRSEVVTKVTKGKEEGNKKVNATRPKPNPDQTKPKCNSPPPPIPENLGNSPAFLKAWEDWISHRREKRAALTPTAAIRQLKKLSELGPERAVAALEHSLTNGYTGVFEDKNGQPAKPGLFDGIASWKKKMEDNGDD